MLRQDYILLFALALAGTAGAETLRVQVQSGQVRGTPSFLGGVVATVGYGQAVEVVSEQGPWRQVRTPDGRAGWMHESALSAKRVKMQAGGTAKTGATSDELALAGKGFNKDVEAQFKAAHAEADFTWVDKMASMKAAEAEVERFVKEGGLALPGGAQ